MTDIVITDLASARGAFVYLAEDAGVSLTALAEEAKVSNVITSFAKNARGKDIRFISTVLPVVAAADWEVVFRKKRRSTTLRERRFKDLADRFGLTPIEE